MTSFDSIEYLRQGNTQQKEIYNLLKTHHIFEKLKNFSPILVGTFPLSITIEGSDLDIICQYDSLNRFRKFLNKTFKEENNFCITKSENAIICNFSIDSFPLEIFGQKIPTHQQNGYKHMIIEYFILKEKGNIFRDKIIELKKMGYKTEPAFAKLLGISGDPYKELLNYKFGSQLSLLENK